jgi:hypothetical protein
MTTARCCCKLNKLLIDCNIDISPTTSKVSLLYGKYRLSFETVNGNKTLKQVLNFNKTFQQVLNFNKTLKQVLNFNKTLKQVRNFNKTIKQVRDFSKMVKQMSNSYFRSMRRTVLY